MLVTILLETGASKSRFHTGIPVFAGSAMLCALPPTTTTDNSQQQPKSFNSYLPWPVTATFAPDQLSINKTATNNNLRVSSGIELTLQ